MKYYMIKTYTCYCGEHMYHFAAIPEGESVEDNKWTELFYSWVADDAYEWWDDQSREEYDDDYDEYFAGCGYDVYEISEAEYLIECGKE